MNKSFLGKEVPKDSVVSEPLVIKNRHDITALENMTKKEVIAYASANGVAVNSRKKKEEIISIILRS
jgi:hypothetical protein